MNCYISLEGLLNYVQHVKPVLRDLCVILEILYREKDVFSLMLFFPSTLINPYSVTSQSKIIAIFDFQLLSSPLAILQ